MKFKNFFEEDNKTGRFIHLSANPIAQINQSKNTFNNQLKPKGLWAGIDKSWIDWVEKNMPEKSGETKHTYTFDAKAIENFSDVKGGSNTVLTIRVTAKDIPEFTKIFAKQMIMAQKQSASEIEAAWKRLEDKHEPIEIDWKEVAKKMAGVLFEPYNPSIGNDFRYMWYNTIDVESICIFHKDAITNWKEIT